MNDTHTNPQFAAQSLISPSRPTFWLAATEHEIALVLAIRQFIGDYPHPLTHYALSVDVDPSRVVCRVTPRDAVSLGLDAVRALRLRPAS